MIWLIGNKGMLGQEVESILKRRNLKYVASDIDVDITVREPVDKFVTRHKPDWIVNCAAYTAVDQAETDEARARQINADGPENIGRAAAEVGARVIHISTDYVFDGQGSRPYEATDPVAPAGAYGRTKAEGERRLQRVCPNSFIVRTAWLYGVGGKNFVETMLRVMSERDEVRVVSDQRGSPTYAVDLASAIVEFVTRDSSDFGIYHYTNEGETTWHGFAEEIKRQGLERGLLATRCEVAAITSADYPTPAARPHYSVLSKTAIRDAFGIDIPDWRDGLSRYFDQRSNHAE